ncbi:MAG: hypothetical protein KGJ80_07525 [Chloroflexota bacterium]|nr:hypothetical protein [Chloroflexota bacterium]
MKRLYAVLIALLLVAVMATPAFAQGPRGGDRFCTGGSETIESNETVDSVILFGCGVRIQSGARVLKDVVSFGGSVVIEKDVRVNGDVVIFGGNLDLAGEAGRDAVLFGGNVTLQPTAVVDRDIITAGGSINRKEGAVVRGRISRGEGNGSHSFRFEPVSPAALGGGLLGGLTGLAFGIVRSIFYALALAALGALTVVFMPAQTKQVSDTAQTYAMPSIGVGCLTSFVAVTLGIVLIITLCGIPFGILALLALVVAWLFGWIALGRLAGEKILEALKARESLRTPIIGVVVGILLLAIVSMVPIIGWLVGLFIGLLGLGAVVLTRFGTRGYPTLTPAAVAIVPAAPSAPAAPSDQAASTGGQSGTS